MVFEYKGTDYEFPDDMDDNQALKLIKQDLGEDTAQTPEPQALPEPEKKGLIERGLNYAGKTIAGTFKHPIQTVKGLGYGAAKSIAGLSTDFAANVNPEDNEDINMTMPGRFPARALTSETSKDIIKRREGLAEQAVTPITENLTPQESRAAKIGEILAPASAGEIALGKPVGMIAKAGEKLVGGALKGVGEKAVSITLKPKAKDFNSGFKVENVYKYDLDGPIDKTIKKTQDKITELSTELKSRIQQGADEGARVNAFDLIDQTINKVKGEGIKNLNKNKAINQLNSLKEEISMTNPDGVLDLADAQDFKRSVGAEGAWYESKWGRQVDPDANAKQKAYSELYHSIKNDIEVKAPEGIKEINKQLSELIPMENTALKRLYVSQRNEMIPLKDMIGLATAAATGPKGWLLYGANKALNSPVTGSGAYRLGEAMTGGRLRPTEIPALKPKTATVQDAVESPTFLRNKKELKSYPYLL